MTDIPKYSRGKNPNSHKNKQGGRPFGYKVKEETKLKIGLKNKTSLLGNTPWNKGKKMSEEFCKKNSEGHKGQTPWNYIDGRGKFLSPGRYGDDWDNIRFLVYKRDKFQCQNCGNKNKRLDVHHRIPFLDGGSNDINNLISLCRSCHRKEEARLMRIKKQKTMED